MDRQKRCLRLGVKKTVFAARLLRTETDIGSSFYIGIGDVKHLSQVESN